MIHERCLLKLPRHQALQLNEDDLLVSGQSIVIADVLVHGMTADFSQTTHAPSLENLLGRGLRYYSDSIAPAENTRIAAFTCQGYKSFRSDGHFRW